MHFERASRRTQELNLTPLVDVVFQLIIFFMLTTSFIKITSIELSLPADNEETAAPATPVTDPLAKVTLVDIADDGRVYLNRKFVETNDIKDALQNILRVHTDMEVLVRTAPHVNVQKLVDVMDVVHVAGGRKIAVDNWDGTLPASEQQPTKEPEMINPFSVLDAPAAAHEAATPAPTPSEAPLVKPAENTAPEPKKPSPSKNHSLSPRAKAAREKMYQPPENAPVNSPLMRLRQQLGTQ